MKKFENSRSIICFILLMANMQFLRSQIIIDTNSTTGAIVTIESTNGGLLLSGTKTTPSSFNEMPPVGLLFFNPDSCWLYYLSSSTKMPKDYNAKYRNLNFWTLIENSNQMYIQKENVGIGTNDACAALEVNGTLRINPSNYISKDCGVSEIGKIYYDITDRRLYVCTSKGIKQISISK